MSAPIQKAKPAKAKTGDILQILLPSGLVGFGKVLYTSRRYRDVMLFGVALGAYSSSAVPPSLDYSAALFYTSVVCPSHVGWTVVAREPVSAAEADRSLRIVAADVWLGDTYIRPASDSDRRTLPQMSLLGCRILQKKVYGFFSNDT
jgi:hypothetical protein